jgi:PleD family two-component response regulator
MTEKSKQVKSRPPVRILIAEDSPTQAEHLQYLLERNNFQVAVAFNGKQALGLLDDINPDLVIIISSASHTTKNTCWPASITC